MSLSLARFFSLASLFLLVFVSLAKGAAEPKVHILSPQDGSSITQQQNTILISGKVASQAARSENVDIMFIIDISGSTSQYAGVDFGDFGQLPDSSNSGGFSWPQIAIRGFGRGRFPITNLRNSILAAEVGAARRLLVQLNSQTTRVGIITFSEGARVLQPLTRDFDHVRGVLDSILAAGPYGGTNMVDGIRTGISELMGLGSSEKRAEAVKAEFLFDRRLSNAARRRRQSHSRGYRSGDQCRTARR